MREARERLEPLLVAARRLRAGADELAQATRVNLAANSGLTLAGVDFAIERCLETDPSEAELAALCASVRPTRHSHVLLSANVFVGAHRAIALALAASSHVSVRASRRDPDMARFLYEASAHAFELVDELTPAPGEQVFAFGSNETLTTLSATWPAGVHANLHGSGFGLIALQAPLADQTALAHAIAEDLVPFDQRGCLSPRVVLFEGQEAAALALAEAVRAALDIWEACVPRGELSRAEQSEAVRCRETLRYAGHWLSAKRGGVGVLQANSALTLSPVGRHLLVLPVTDAAALIAPVAHHVTTYAAYGTGEFVSAIGRQLPLARRAELGALQRPAFDGPVDRRGSVTNRSSAADGAWPAAGAPSR